MSMFFLCMSVAHNHSLQQKVVIITQQLVNVAIWGRKHLSAGGRLFPHWLCCILVMLISRFFTYIDWMIITLWETMLLSLLWNTILSGGIQYVHDHLSANADYNINRCGGIRVLSATATTRTLDSTLPHVPWTFAPNLPFGQLLCLLSQEHLFSSNVKQTNVNFLQMETSINLQIIHLLFPLPFTTCSLSILHSCVSPPNPPQQLPLIWLLSWQPCSAWFLIISGPEITTFNTAFRDFWVEQFACIGHFFLLKSFVSMTFLTTLFWCPSSLSEYSLLPTGIFLFHHCTSWPGSQSLLSLSCLSLCPPVSPFSSVPPPLLQISKSQSPSLHLAFQTFSTWCPTRT